MSLPVLIDLTDHPFDAFNPYNLLQLKQTHQQLDIFESTWVKVLQIIPNIIEYGEKYFNLWYTLLPKLQVLSQVSPMHSEINGLYETFKNHFETQMYIISELKTWRETSEEILIKMKQRRKKSRNEYNEKRKEFNNVVDKNIKQYNKNSFDDLNTKRKEMQTNVLNYGIELNHQTQQMLLMTEQNIVHLFHMYSKYINNTAKRHFSEDVQTPIINSLIIQTNTFKSSIEISRDIIPKPISLGYYLLKKEQSHEKKLYYIFNKDNLIGLKLGKNIVEESDKINILTTNFKQVDNILECYGIQGKSLLIAPSKEDAIEMQGLIEKQKEVILNGTPISNRTVHPKLSQILEREENMKCAECGCSNPQWISVNLGVVFCIKCSGIHRSLGVHYSRVKSTTLDNIEDYMVRILDSLGNEKVNSIYQQNYMIYEDSSLDDRSQIIRRKYIGKLFVKEDKQDWIPYALKGIEDDNILALVNTFAHVEIRDLYGNQLLIKAIQSKRIAIACYLIVNGYDLNEQDENGNTALHLTAYENLLEIAVVLVRFKCDCSLKNKDGLTAIDISKQKGNGFISSLIRFSLINAFEDLNEVIKTIEKNLIHASIINK